MAPYRHRIRIRYGEVDQQGVVFNAHYLAYLDDTLENWLEDLGPLRRELQWDMMPQDPLHRVARLCAQR